MTREDIIRMAQECNLIGMRPHLDGIYQESIERFAALVVAAERDVIADEWWMCVQSDLENGVKSLNERASEKWHKEYPAISGFGAFLRARGNTP